MAIVGIHSLIFGVDDIQECTRFFDDYGLPLISSGEHESLFQLADGSKVKVLSINDKRIPTSSLVGTGVREVVWGVDTQEAFELLVKDLSQDRDVVTDTEGVAHFLTDCGLPLALSVFDKKPVINAPDPVNAPGVVNRLNKSRKWIKRARPKTIQHVVFAVKDYNESFAFFRDRLNFKLSDVQNGFGIYSRGDGSISHHNLFLLESNLSPRAELKGQPHFEHANFGVEDIDEIMIGANYMERKGWKKSSMGLGRHRVDSGLFYYLTTPAGGQLEYGTDGDFVDDNWIPREWTVPLFGVASFVHNIPDWLWDEPEWEVKFLNVDDDITASDVNKNNK